MDSKMPALANAIGAGIALNTAFKGACSFLATLCMPATKELGLWAKDVVHEMRIRNLVAMTQKAQQKFVEHSIPDGAHAAPRLVHRIIEESSWIEDSSVQELWAGLLASSCDLSGADQSNLIFINLLADMTSLEVRLFEYGCKNAEKNLASGGLIDCESLYVSLKQLCEITGETDVQRLDRELDHMHVLGLIQGGFIPDYSPDAVAPSQANLTPTALGLQLYARCLGSRVSAVEFFQIKSLKSD